MSLMFSWFFSLLCTYLLQGNPSSFCSTLPSSYLVSPDGVTHDTCKYHIILNIYNYTPFVESDEYYKTPLPTTSKLTHSHKIFEVLIYYPEVKILAWWHEKIRIFSPQKIYLWEEKWSKITTSRLWKSTESKQQVEKHLFIKSYWIL